MWDRSSSRHAYYERTKSRQQVVSRWGHYTVDFAWLDPLSSLDICRDSKLALWRPQCFKKGHRASSSSRGNLILLTMFNYSIKIV